MTDLDYTIAAIRFAKDDHIDGLLEAVAHAIRSRGLPVVGYLQREEPDGPGCCQATFLEDLSDGERLRITQALGPGSRGCRLDPRALADASARLFAKLDASTQFLILNRFGKGESDGQGMRDVIAKACELGVPVLLAVREAYEPGWHEFVAGSGTLLAPDAKAAAKWAFDAIAWRQSKSNAA
ncbi:MAG: DUF2478 domain-containing protein [Nitratireductor sp.]|nr:DUF2478 domain-containing protein [Nitratireductor sp.]